MKAEIVLQEQQRLRSTEKKLEVRMRRYLNGPVLSGHDLVVGVGQGTVVRQRSHDGTAVIPVIDEFEIAVENLPLPKKRVIHRFL